MRINSEQAFGLNAVSEKVRQVLHTEIWHLRNEVVPMLAITVGALALFVVLTLLLQPGKYSLKGPGGLAFSEFSGYESWRVISVSHNADKLAVLLGNPAMIDPYMAGIPVDGGWNALKAETYTGPPTVLELGSPLCQTRSWRSEENCGRIVLVAIRKALGHEDRHANERLSDQSRAN